MKLKSGSLYWPRQSRVPLRTEELDRDWRCDVAIIGAGLSGALAAFELASAGLEVALVDKREAARGSTAASTALVLYELDEPLTRLMERRGPKQAMRSYQCCLEAINRLEERVRSLGESCEFRKRRSLYLASCEGDVRDLVKEHRARTEAGIRVQYLDGTEVRRKFGFDAPAALWSKQGAEVNPCLLTERLLRRVGELGGRLFTGVRAVRYYEGLEGVTVYTARGHRIRAKWLVVASGYETGARIARRKLRLKSSYAIVTRPQDPFPHWPGRCLIWETKRPYVYLRSTVDDRIMIGGGDEEYRSAKSRDKLLSAKVKGLEEELRRKFPEADSEAAYGWAGTFGETKDSLPYVGPARRGSRVLYALCYGANGTNFAMMAAEILRDLICGKKNRDASLFSFER